MCEWQLEASSQLNPLKVLYPPSQHHAVEAPRKWHLPYLIICLSFPSVASLARLPCWDTKYMHIYTIRCSFYALAIKLLGNKSTAAATAWQRENWSIVWLTFDWQKQSRTQQQQWQLEHKLTHKLTAMGMGNFQRRRHSKKIVDKIPENWRQQKKILDT